jgi:hypothetical protein
MGDFAVNADMIAPVEVGAEMHPAKELDTGRPPLKVRVGNRVGAKSDVARKRQIGVRTGTYTKIFCAVEELVGMVCVDVRAPVLGPALGRERAICGTVSIRVRGIASRLRLRSSVAFLCEGR